MAAAAAPVVPRAETDGDAAAMGIIETHAERYADYARVAVNADAR